MADSLLWRTLGGGSHRATVVYVHGFFDTTVSSVEKYRLWEQFAASGLDATYIVAPAPTGTDDRAIRSPDLAALLARVNAEEPLGDGPLLVIGHSAAHATIGRWLAAGQGPLIHHIILLDANYGNYERFRAFPGRLTILGRHTGAEGRRLAGARGGVLLARLPPCWSSRERAAQTLYAQSQYSHAAMVRPESGVIPLMLTRINFRARARRWHPAWGFLAGAALAGGIWLGWRRWRR